MAANDLEKSFRELTKTENIFLFVPNIIGYARWEKLAKLVRVSIFGFLIFELLPNQSLSSFQSLIVD
jgi:hypothetical protein